MELKYQNTESSINNWTKHFTLMSEDHISPVVPGYYRVSGPDIEAENTEKKEDKEVCTDSSNKEKVPISISTPSEQIIEVIRSEDKAVHKQKTRPIQVQRKRKAVAVEEPGGNKRKSRRSVKYCEVPKGAKRFIAW